MHRFTDSMPGRAMISHLARNYATPRIQANRIQANRIQASRVPAKRMHPQPLSGPSVVEHTKLDVAYPKAPHFKASSSQQASSSRCWMLPLLLLSLAGSLVGCGGITTSEETNTATTTVDTAEVFNTPPSLTIVAPEGTRPDNSAFLQVAENSLNVTQVAAEDVPGSTLIYRLQDGEDKDKFVLDESTGTLRFKNLPDWENPVDADTNNNYMLLWQVISSSGDARSQFMVIQVTDLPE